MLEKIYLQILNMSFTASFVILFVLLARLLLKKAPKVFSYALWSVVLFRLVCPISFESIISLLPTKANPISQDIVYMKAPKVDTGVTAINNAVNAVLPPATPYSSINPLQVWVFIGSLLWVLGIIALLVYSLVALVRFNRQLRNAKHYRENVFLADAIDTAFVMGVFRPKIYLPANLTDSQRNFILLHEQTHIKRLDHILKLISFFTLCVHWFNPLVWVAFFVSSKDMEMACDEAIIKQLGVTVKKEYSSSLLTLATTKRIVGGTPLAFGEGDTKGRILNVLGYKQPAFWVVIVAMLATAVVGVGLVADPVNTILLMKADEIKSVYPIDTALNGTMIWGDDVLELSSAMMPETHEFINQLKVKKEADSSRDQGREAVNQIRLMVKGDLVDEQGTLYLSFSRDFTEVWLEDEKKSTSTYAVKDPAKVKAFFERQFGSVAPAIEVGSVDYLWEARTQYVGDNSAVGNIISALNFPEDVHYNGFALHTSEHPYGITINFRTDTDARNYYAGALHQDPFTANAVIMFSLIENVELITFVLDDGVNPYSLQFADGIASAYLGEDYFARTKTREGLEKVLEEVSKKIPENTDKIRAQQQANTVDVVKVE